MTQRIQGDQFGRPACLAAFAVSVGVLFAAITGSLCPPRAGSVWPPFDTFSHGAVEGFNNKARVTTRKAYGFRTYRHAEIALYHALGNLPEPPFAHRFC